MNHRSSDTDTRGVTSMLGAEPYRAYPAYKGCGVEWLGEIPTHWEVKRLQWAITFQRGHDLPTDERELGDVPVVSSSGISSTHSKAVAKPPGIVTGRCGTIGQFYMINQSYWPLNTALYSIELHGNEPRFLIFMLFHLSSLFFLHSIKSAVPAVDRNDVHAEYTAVPTVPEQRAIAAFLDRETARIDALVAKKEQLIELLQEKRAALISHAVTKGLPADAAAQAGLDPDVPMKDSGVDWLGRIPAHWEVKKIKSLLVCRKGAIKTGPFGSQLHSFEMMHSDIKVFNQRTVIDRDIRGGLNYISMAKFNELQSFEAFPGDLLITTRGTIGRCMIIPFGAPRGILHPCLMRIQIDTKLAYNHYIELLIEESGLTLTQLQLMSNSTTIDVIYSDSLKETLLPIPPAHEQRAIAAFLDTETARIDALVGKVRDAIDRHKELRTALISAVVTGKIDVREVV